MTTVSYSTCKQCKATLHTEQLTQRPNDFGFFCKDQDSCKVRKDKANKPTNRPDQESSE